MTAGHLKFNWNRYIDFADELLKSMAEDEDDELKDRCGISRAYYGAFHRAKSYLDKIGITIDINGSDSHNKVIEEYKKIGKNNKLWARIGLDLERLKIQRKKADYKDKYFIDSEKSHSLKKQLQTAVLKAYEVVKLIDKIEEQERLK